MVPSQTIVKLSIGVPQGSIVSPGLFPIYVNDFPQSISQGEFICMLTTLQLLSLVIAPMHLLPVQCGNTALEYTY